MAHELVHVYVLYLQRAAGVHTPPDITYGGYGDENTGESGRYWEYLTLGGFVDMRMSADGMEAVALRDNHGQRCWRIRSIVIDGILARDFATYLPPGTPINDPEHPKDRYTVLMSTFNWKDRFSDVFPPSAAAQAAQGPQELPQQLITRLTGPNIMSTDQYRMCGQDLRNFALNPRTTVTATRSSGR
ncbi:hypothetical protein VTK26DRAFT_8320 [Humicola hyalothermophila]